MDKQKKYPSNGQQGSTIALVMILTLALTVAAASLLKLGTAERRLNQGNFLSLEAQDGAESLINYAMVQIQDRWERRSTFEGDASNDLGINPLIIPSSASTFLGSGYLSQLEVGGGTVSDPVTTIYKDIVMQGRVVKLYSRALTAHPALPIKEAFCETTFKLYSRSMLSYALFYNRDLELNPGPEMVIEGPVHANGDIYLQALGGLKFDSTVSATGDIRYGDLDGHVSMDGDVQVKLGYELDSDGEPILSRPIWSENFEAATDESGDTTYYDSLHSDWSDIADDRFGGKFEDSAKPVSIPVLNGVVGASLGGNEAYALVEPLTDSTNTVNRSINEVAPYQLAYKSGMIIKVEINEAPEPGEGKYTVTAKKYTRSDSSDPSSEIVVDENGKVTMDIISDPNPSGATGSDPDAWLVAKGIVTATEYDEAAGAPVGGFYDMRQQRGMDVIDIDIEKLKAAIEGDSDSSEYWNGALFVELPHYDPDPTRTDGVMVPYNDVALRLKNGSELPNPSHMNDEVGETKGFTLATNGQLYIMGNYNADGDDGTGSSTDPDDADEIPAALAADSITILSENFKDEKSKLFVNHGSRTAATYTEISAALITGTVTTDETYTSGGAHNLPRFLEDWNGVTLTYRGSMIAFFESEAGDKGFTPFWSQWYRAPERDWGHHQYFAEGKDPPPLQGDRVFTYSGHRFVSSSEFNVAKSANPSFFTSFTMP